MVQEVNANYDTIYKTASGNLNLTIMVQPESVTPNTVEADLLLTVGKKIINNTPGIEGELLIVEKNSLKDISFDINENGELIINAPDADNYSIDDNGYLIYTYR